MAGKKGMSNVKSATLIQRLRREFPGYHAVVEMTRNAMHLQQEAFRRKEEGEAWTTLLKEATDVHSQVAKYIAPQLKAVDITSGGEGIVFNFNIGQQQPKAVVNQEPDVIEHQADDVMHAVTQVITDEVSEESS